MRSCKCRANSYNRLNPEQMWYPTGLTLNIEVRCFGKRVGIFACRPACDHEHQLCNFIAGAHHQAGFNTCMGNYNALHQATTILQICLEHNFIIINVDQHRIIS
jgi:hypothetical protein